MVTATWDLSGVPNRRPGTSDRCTIAAIPRPTGSETSRPRLRIMARLARRDDVGRVQRTPGRDRERLYVVSLQPFGRHGTATKVAHAPRADLPGQLAPCPGAAQPVGRQRALRASATDPGRDATPAADTHGVGCQGAPRSPGSGPRPLAGCAFTRARLRDPTSSVGCGVNRTPQRATVDRAPRLDSPARAGRQQSRSSPRRRMDRVPASPDQSMPG